MDDRIIDFNELKNKAKEKDEDKLVDKLENYMYSLYYDMAQGKITMADFTKNIYKYMEENNITQEQFFNIQKKLMERYGFDSSMIDEQLKSAGINVSDISSDYEKVRKNMSFNEKYNSQIETKAISRYRISNDKNNVTIVLDEENVLIYSEGKIDLADLELSDFLCSYKKLRDNGILEIKLCENTKDYQY